MRLHRWTWKNVSLPDDTAERLGLNFQADILEAALAPVNWDRAGLEELQLLVHLGDLYSRLGRLSEGLEVDRTLVRLRPDEPIFLYNLACSHSRLGEVEPALQALEDAVRLGYHDFEQLRRDRDLDNLKSHERFHRLLEQLDPSL